jgi:hypothetical protein
MLINYNDHAFKMLRAQLNSLNCVEFLTHFDLNKLLCYLHLLFIVYI